MPNRKGKRNRPKSSPNESHIRTPSKRREKDTGGRCCDFDTMNGQISGSNSQFQLSPGPYIQGINMNGGQYTYWTPGAQGGLNMTPTTPNQSSPAAQMERETPLIHKLAFYERQTEFVDVDDEKGRKRSKSASAIESKTNLDKFVIDTNKHAFHSTTQAAESGDVYRTRAKSAAVENTAKRLEEELYVCGWIETQDQRAYRYCTRRVQTAISKCNANAHDKNKLTIYQGKIGIYATQALYLEELFKSAQHMERMMLSNIQKHRCRDSPVVIIVSSSECGKIDEFCASFEPDQKEKKLVCVLIVNENGYIEKPVVVETTWGLLQQCSQTDQIACCVDDLLERHIFRFYENVLKVHFDSMSTREKHCLEQDNENDEVLREATALHAKFEVPLPEWLERRSESVIDICEDEYILKELEPVFRKLEEMPFVFDIVPEGKQIAVKVLKASTKKETTQQVDAVKKECKIKADLFKIKTITFNKCTKYKYESGNELSVENRTGTLSGFAKMTQLQTEKMVAILARHVAEDTLSRHFDSTLKIQKENVGVIWPRPSNLDRYPDISIADVSKEISQHCDKKFKNEDKERLNAVPLQTDSGEQKRRRFERVHIWGAKSRPGTAQVKEYGISRPEATSLIYIAKEPHASSETNWKKGDSGAMVLSERYRKEKDQNLIALGLYIGESIEDDGAKYVVFPLQSGFGHLSKDYDATFSLYSDESSEED